MSLEIRVLGSLTAFRGGEAVLLPPSRKTRALLAYLALVDRPQRRERLCEMFWEIPDDPRGALRWSLSKIRQILPSGRDGILKADRNVVGLDTSRIIVDIKPLRELGHRDIEALDTEALEKLVGLFRGGFLDDLSLPRCPEFEAWRVAIGDELGVTRLRLLRTLIDRLADEPSRALPHAHALQALEPDDHGVRAEIQRLCDAARQSVLLQRRPAEDDAHRGTVRTGEQPPQVGGTQLPAAEKPLLVQEIRGCVTPDGVRLAYALSGDGPPLVKASHWMSHLERDWDSPIWKHWMEALSARFRFVRYDQRGNGLSDRDPADLSFAAMVSDLESVVDAAGSRRVFLLGISQGCAVSIAYAARHPERVAGMVLYGGFARGWRKRADARGAARRQAMSALIREGWGQDDPVFRQMFTSMYIPEATPEQKEWYNELQRATTSADVAHRIFEEVADIDVEALLPRIRVPTLVAHATRDAAVPFELGQAIAAGIPGARFLALDSANHVLLAHEPAFATLVEEAHRFLTDPEETRQLALPRTKLGIDRSRQYVTVLAAEVVSPMHVFETADPEVAIRQLQPVHDRLIQVIEEHGGVVTAGMDGAVTAAFGLARATEDHAFLACRAALAARLAVEDASRGTSQVRAGIDTGEVIVRHQWTADGNRTELNGLAPRAANRLMRALHRATIAATARARTAAGGYAQMQRMTHSEYPQLGRDEHVYELLSENQALSRWHLRANRGLTKLTARDTELESLLAAWRRVREGQGQVVGIVADAGLGKSRLAHEFLAIGEVAAFTVLESGGLEFDSAVSLGVIKKLLLSACDIRGEDALPEARGRFLRKHAELGLDSRHIAPLSFLVDLPVEDADWRQIDARERTRLIREAVTTFLVAMSRVSPVAVLVEDLHWIDAESEKVLDRLVETVGANRILLLATYRPQYRHGWGRRGYFQQIRLERFVREDADRFLCELLGPDSSLRELRLLLAERAEGTPLFLEEMVRALAASGALAGEPGRFRPVGAIDTVVIPSSIQSVIAARIGQLSDIERQVLQIASVIGRNVPAPLIRRLAPETGLETALDRLKDLEFLFEVQSYPHVEYTFKHALTLNVAYASLLVEDRRTLHARVLAAMEALYADSLTHHIEQLAEHAVRAERWETAARCLFAAAQRAEERSAYAAAAQFLENARSAVAALPRTPETIAQAIDLRVRMRTAYGVLGAYRKALEPLLEARGLAAELGDRQRISDVLLHLSYLNSCHGRYEEALEPAETLNRDASAAGMDLCIGESDLAASQAHVLRGEARQVLARLAPHEENFTSRWRHERFGQIGARAVWYLGCRAQAAALLGRFGDADRALAELQRVAGEVARPLDTCGAAFFSGFVGVLRGPDPDLVASLRDCAKAAEADGVLLVQRWLLTILGHAEFMLGETEAAYATLETAIIEAERLDLPHWECHARTMLAYLRARLREPEAAANLAHALDLARRRADPWSEVLALRGLAELRSSKASLALLEEACALARARDLRPELARSLRALGSAQHRASMAAAASTLEEAAALFGAMRLRDSFLDTGVPVAARAAAAPWSRLGGPRAAI